MNRAKAIAAIAVRLQRRRLVWAGVRGDDAEPLAAIPQFDSSYTIINAYARHSAVTAVAYEDLSGRRVDLETWDIDDHLPTEETRAFRRAILQRLSTESALVTYRPSRFLSSLWFARRDRCLSLGMFGGHQSAFEHKPWVEGELAEWGVPVIPWTYVADEEQLRAFELVGDGPLMLRRSRTSGGEGIVRVDDRSQLAEHWFESDESFVSVAPYLEEGLPVNIGGTVWHDGVTTHYLSLQLIGVPTLVRRPFGYCGNDFASMADLEPELVQRIDETTCSIGRWLATKGYRGTFGVDFLLRGGIPLFTEVNARFQGSTHLSSRISVERDEPCLLLEHVAAMLGMDAPHLPPLSDRMRDLPALSHVVVHSTHDLPASIDPAPLVQALERDPLVLTSDVHTRPDLVTDPDATVLRFVVQDRVTTGGFELRDPWAKLVACLKPGRTGTTIPASPGGESD